MTSKRVAALAKLMADEKVDQILKAASSSTGMTTKQLAKAVQRPASQLYYTINKMVDAGLLEIVRQEKVKNLDEYYYSSQKITGQDDLSVGDSTGLNVAPAWINEHLDDLTQLVIYRNNQFLTGFQKNFSDPTSEKSPSPAGFADTQLQLSPEADQKLWQQIVTLIDQAEQADQGKNKRTVNLLVERWRTDNQ